MSAQIIAASATGLVQEIGSYAGYAAILGLGILALLYFAQARELKRLRDWAGDAPERGTALEQQRILQPDPNRRVVAQPIQPIQPSTPTTPAAQAATAALYASVGAPAPGTVPPPGSLARPAAVPGASAAPGAPAPGAPGVPGAMPVPGAPAAPSALAPGAPGAPAVPGAPGAGTATTPAATPAAAAAAARASAGSRSPSAASVYPYANGGSLGQPTAESAAARPDPIGPPPPLHDEEDDGYGFFSGRRIGIVVGGVVAVVLVAVVLIVALGGDDAPPKPNDFGDQPAAQTSGDGSASSSSSSPGGSGSGTKTTAAGLTAAERRATNVAVLNGTTQTGLARNVGDKIEQDGYTIGKVETNPDQTLTTTEIRYTDGHEAAANAVAKVIGIARSAVQPADLNTTASADADVVVIVGSDQIE